MPTLGFKVLSGLVEPILPLMRTGHKSIEVSAGHAAPLRSARVPAPRVSRPAARFVRASPARL